MKSIINYGFLILLVSSLYGCSNPDPAIKSADAFISSQQIDKTQVDWKTSLEKPVQLTFSEGVDYYWDLETSHGKLSIKLFQEDAPMHVSSTVYLTRLGFYDGLTFHRVIPGFMAQGGDPLGNGQGNPGYKYNGEFNGTNSHNKAGILSMANAGPGTDGSQFFITFKPTPFLDNRHTVFGEVQAGLEDTLTTIEKLGSRSGRPQETVTINKASIRTVKTS